MTTDNIKTEKLNYFSALKFLSKYFMAFKSNFIMFYAGWFFDMAAELVAPVIFGIMIDQIVYGGNLNIFLKLSLVYVILSIFGCILYFFIYAQHQYLMNHFVYAIAKDLFEHIHLSSVRFLSESSSGQMISAVQLYCRECMPFIMRNVIHFINSIIAIILLSLYILRINTALGLIIVLAAPMSVLINTYFGKKISNYALSHKSLYDTHISYLFEILGNLTDIRLLGARPKVLKTMKKQLGGIYSIKIKSGISILNAENMVAFSNLIIQLLIFSLVGYTVAKGSITIGVFTVIMTFYNTLVKKINTFTTYFLDAQERISYIQKIYDYFQAPPEDTEGRTMELHVTEGHIRFENIDFSYNENEPVLKGFSMEAPPRSLTALCGESGCGKTTAGALLLGFYRPEKGKITIDSQDLSKCTLSSIRKNIGMVSQDITIFDGSIKYNILLGNPGASSEEAADALKKAGIWEFVSSLPQKMDTILGTKGISLSGGQRQRIAIARIYLKNPKIIVFDEATSALDGETESKILTQWQSLLKNRTAIVIAHRLESVMLCENCIVIQDKKAAETGSPSILAQKDSLFGKLFHLSS